MACIWIISCTAGQQRGLTGRGTATGRHANRQAPSLYVQGLPTCASRCSFYRKPRLPLQLSGKAIPLLKAGDAFNHI